MDPAPAPLAPRRFVDALRHVGPGLILTAGIVGTGELVLTPRVAAEHGFSLLWLILLGCVVKVFVQIELGRYAVATGQTTLAALDALPGPRLRAGWMLLVWAPVFLGMISVIGGILGGSAEVLRLAGVDVDARLLVVALGLVCSVAIGFGRYVLIERGSTALVAVFIFATLIALAALQGTPYRVTLPQLASGFTFDLPPNVATAFAAFGIIGVGAAELIYYPYWCLEKGYAQRVGPRQPGDAGWTERARGWLRVMRVDAWCSMAVYTFTTAAFYVLGAAILHAKGLKVANADMIPTLAHMYLETYGGVGLAVFVAGAFATLFSTAFAATASNARLLADAVRLFRLGGKTAATAAAPGHAAGAGAPVVVGGSPRAVQLAAIGLPLYAAGLYLLVPQPVTLILINGVGQALLLPFLAGAALFLRYRRLDPALRPGVVWTACLWLSAACMAALGAWQLWQEIAKRLG